MGTTFLMQSLPSHFVLPLSACDRRSSLSEQRKTLPCPTPLPVEASALTVATSASTAGPTALTVDANPDPAAPEPFPAAPKHLTLDPEAPARTGRDRFHRPTTVRLEPDRFVLVGIGSTALFDDADRLLRRALTAYFHDRLARHPARPVSIFFFSARTDSDAWCHERYGASGSDFLGFYERARLGTLLLPHCRPDDDGARQPTLASTAASRLSCSSTRSLSLRSSRNRSLTSCTALATATSSLASRTSASACRRSRRSSLVFAVSRRAFVPRTSSRMLLKTSMVTSPGSIGYFHFEVWNRSVAKATPT
jgi:hypothetical protein